MHGFAVSRYTHTHKECNNKLKFGKETYKAGNTVYILHEENVGFCEKILKLTNSQGCIQ